MSAFYLHNPWNTLYTGRSFPALDEDAFIRIVKWEEGTGNKKYKVHLSNGKTVQFGSKKHQHYRDTTPLNLYSHLNHRDKKRKALYRKRHGSVKLKDGRLAYKVKYSPSWFSWRYLWT